MTYEDDIYCIMGLSISEFEAKLPVNRKDIEERLVHKIHVCSKSNNNTSNVKLIILRINNFLLSNKITLTKTQIYDIVCSLPKIFRLAVTSSFLKSLFNIPLTYFISILKQCHTYIVEDENDFEALPTEYKQAILDLIKNNEINRIENLDFILKSKYVPKSFLNEYAKNICKLFELHQSYERNWVKDIVDKHNMKYEDSDLLLELSKIEPSAITYLSRNDLKRFIDYIDQMDTSKQQKQFLQTRLLQNKFITEHPSILKTAIRKYAMMSQYCNIKPDNISIPDNILKSLSINQLSKLIKKSINYDGTIYLNFNTNIANKILLPLIIENPDYYKQNLLPNILKIEKFQRR